MHRNRLPSKAALALGAALLSFALLEQAFRIHVFGPGAFSFRVVNSFVPVGEAGIVQASDHAEIIYELKPSLDTYFKSTAFRTNSMGLRDGEYEITKPHGAFRVVVLGDSFSMPAGVDIAASFHSILEARFNAGSHARDVEFINFAVGGYSLRQYAAVLRHKALAYGPDLILVGWCPGNDHEVPPGQPFERPYVAKPKVNAFFRSFLLNGKYRQRALFGVIPDGLGTAETYSETETDYVVRYFGEIRADARDIPVVVAYLAHLYNPSHIEQARMLEGLATEAGFHFVNLGDPDTFGTDDLASHRLNPIDAHPNAHAHEVFADRLQVFLEKFMTEEASPGTSLNQARARAGP